MPLSPMDQLLHPTRLPLPSPTPIRPHPFSAHDPLVPGGTARLLHWRKGILECDCMSAQGFRHFIPSSESCPWPSDAMDTHSTTVTSASVGQKNSGKHWPSPSVALVGLGLGLALGAGLVLAVKRRHITPAALFDARRTIMGLSRVGHAAAVVASVGRKKLFGGRLLRSQGTRSVSEHLQGLSILSVLQPMFWALVPSFLYRKPVLQRKPASPASPPVQTLQEITDDLFPALASRAPFPDYTNTHIFLSNRVIPSPSPESPLPDRIPSTFPLLPISYDPLLHPLLHLDPPIPSSAPLLHGPSSTQPPPPIHPSLSGHPSTAAPAQSAHRIISYDDYFVYLDAQPTPSIIPAKPASAPPIMDPPGSPPGPAAEGTPAGRFSSRLSRALSAQGRRANRSRSMGAMRTGEGLRIVKPRENTGRAERPWALPGIFRRNIGLGAK